MRRRALLAAPAALLTSSSPFIAMARSVPSSSSTFDTQTSAVDLAAALAAGRIDAVHLVRSCRERIARIDKAGPKINSVIELNPDALAIAKELDA